MRTSLPLLVCATAASAGCFALLAAASSTRADSLSDWKTQLASDDATARRTAIDALVALDNREAFDVLVSALRRAFQEDDRVGKARQKANAANLRRIRSLTEEIRALSEQYQAGKLSRDDWMGKMTPLLEASSEAFKEATAIIHRFAPHRALVTYGAEAISRFRSADVVARLEDIVKHESAGRMRNACLRALTSLGTEAVVPTLLVIAKDRDPRARAYAVRALVRHVAQPEVLARVTECAQDKCWQVRRGAYRALAQASTEGRPSLEAALEKEDGDQLRLVQRCLAESAGAGDGPPVATVRPFGLPLTSTRVCFVVDLTTAVEKRADYVRASSRRRSRRCPTTRCSRS
jgi:HEAT repeat protein